MNSITVNTAPSLKELQKHIIPQYATDWKGIGNLLGVPDNALKIIEYDERNKAEPCCTAMLNKWLQLDPTASWKCLLEAINGEAADEGDYH